MTSPERWAGSFNSSTWKYLSKNTTYLCRNVFFLKNCYDIFDKYGNAVRASYPNDEIRKRQKYSWGVAHNYYEKQNIFFERSLEIKEDQNVGSEITYIVKHHEDSDNYFHWIFENLTNLILLTNIVDQSFLNRIRFVTIGQRLKPFQAESINKVFASINQPCPIIEESINDIFFAKKAIVTHSKYPSWRCKTAIMNLRNTLISKNTISIKNNRRIFIER